MAFYMVQAAYTPESIAAMVKKPEDRAISVQATVEKLGGKLQSLWFCFGEYDVVGIAEMPDNVGAAAFAFAATQSGALKSLRTTPLMSTTDAVQAMKKAADASYRAPGR